MSTLRKTINTGLEKVLIVLMAVLVIDVLWQVFSRYLLSSPSSFTDEMAGFLLIWVGLLGAAYVSGRNEHLAIDLLIQKSSPKRRVLLEKIISLLEVLFAITVLIIGGTWLTYTRFALNVRSAALDLPLGYVYLVLPLSGLLILFFSMGDLFSKETQKN